MPLNVEKVKWDHPALAGPFGAHATLTTPLATGFRPTPSVNIEPGTIPTGDDFADWVLAPAARIPPIPARTGLQAVLFDLDGVLVNTAEFHYLAWKRLADELGIPFDRHMNHSFRGVGRTDCLQKLLGEHAHFFADEEKRLLADRKNSYYLERVQTLTPKDLAPNAAILITSLKALPGAGGGRGGVRLAVVSASKNARLVLELLGITLWFDTVIDGNDVIRSKPDPQGFLLAAERLRTRPEHCVVIEDAESGIRAARAAGMSSLGIGKGITSAQYAVHAMTDVTIQLLEAICADQLALQ